MKGLILKDFMNLKKNVKIFAVLLVIYGFMGITSGDGSFFSVIFTILVAILTLSIYSYDELVHWDTYALTLPVSRDSMVQEKYIMMILLTLIGVIIGGVFALIMYFTGGTVNVLSSVQSCAAGAAVAILFYSIIIPFVIKLGVEKSRILLFAIYIIPFVIVVLVQKAMKAGTFRIQPAVIDFVETLIKYAYVIVPVVLIIVLLISYTISVSIYRKKEF